MKPSRWLTLLLLPAIVCPATALASEQERALALYEAGRFAESRELFAALAQDRPNDVELNFRLARIALWFDDADGALARLEKILPLAPHDARLYHALGDAYGLFAQDAPLLAKPKWAQKCRAAYERAVELEPRNPTYRMSLLGYCLLAPRFVGGGDARAAAHAAELERIDPELGRLAWANIHLARKDYACTFAYFEAILSRDSDNFLALYQIGRCAALSGERLEHGLAALRRCLELPAPASPCLPDHPSVHHRIGDILVQLGDRESAQREFATARRLSPDLRPAKMALRY